MHVFMIPRKVLNDGFTKDQEFECLPVDGKVFILGHKACSVKTKVQVLPRTGFRPVPEKEITKEPNDQMVYLPERTGSARQKRSNDWLLQNRSPR